MQAGQGTSSGRARAALPAGGMLLLCLLAGCGGLKPQQVDQALRADPGPSAPGQGVPEQCPIGCPDVVEVSIVGRPDLSTVGPVGVDGRIDLGRLGRLRVEGLTPPEAARYLAAQAGMPPDGVQVRVTEHRSRHVYLMGEITGLQRPVPYQGPEHVVQLLQRAGGLTPGAAVRDVYVIRPHVTDGRHPEVFHVDLQAILARRDQRTNIVLQPFDQVYVGQTRQSNLEKCVPPLFRPIYERLCGLRRTGERGPQRPPGNLPVGRDPGTETEAPPPRPVPTFTSPTGLPSRNGDFLP